MTTKVEAGLIEKMKLALEYHIKLLDSHFLPNNSKQELSVLDQLHRAAEVIAGADVKQLENDPKVAVAVRQAVQALNPANRKTVAQSGGVWQMHVDEVGQTPVILQGFKKLEALTQWAAGQPAVFVPDPPPLSPPPLRSTSKPEEPSRRTGLKGLLAILGVGVVGAGGTIYSVLTNNSYDFNTEQAKSQKGTTVLNEEQANIATKLIHAAQDSSPRGQSILAVRLRLFELQGGMASSKAPVIGKFMTEMLYANNREAIYAMLENVPQSRDTSFITDRVGTSKGLAQLANDGWSFDTVQTPYIEPNPALAKGIEAKIGQLSGLGRGR